MLTSTMRMKNDRVWSYPNSDRFGYPTESVDTPRKGVRPIDQLLYVAIMSDPKCIMVLSKKRKLCHSFALKTVKLLTK